MKIGPFEITWTKAPVPATTVPSGWSTTLGMPFWSSSHGGFPIIQEPFTGAWQRNMGLSAHTLLIYHAIYRCVTLISQDISKMRIRLMEQNFTTKIWSEVERNSPYWPVLIKPNRYQNRIQFFDEWVGSKLIHGNTYVLKARDSRGIVIGLYILDPCRVRVKIGADGQVYYELYTDDLAQIDEESVFVPATEIIHDRYKPLYNCLIGVSPILACALSGLLGLRIQFNSQQFFENASRPGGVLSAPEHIEDDTAKRLKDHWENSYSGANAGRVAVLGDGLKYEPMRESAVNSQLVEQSDMSEQNVCTAFGVPPYMIGVGDPPSYNNIEALNQQYYSQCLQNLVESIELLLDEGLGLTLVTGKIYGTEFDLSDLLRMDTATKSKTWGDLVKGGIAAPNEGRAQFDLPPAEGGDKPYLQQQNYSLEALAKRDAKDDPFATSATPPTNSADGEEDTEEEGSQDAPTDEAAARQATYRQIWYASRVADI